MVSCATVSYMFRELVNRLCDWKQYESVKNRGTSVTSVQLSSIKSKATARESMTSTSQDLTERTYLTLRISNQSAGGPGEGQVVGRAKSFF